MPMVFYLPCRRREGPSSVTASRIRALRGAFVCVTILATWATSCGSARTSPVEIDLDAPAPIAPVPAAHAAAPAPPPGEGYEIYPGVSVDEAWVDCRTEDECVIVAVGCCDHCNGGAITAVNVAFAERAKDLISEKLAAAGPCKACTHAACDAASAHQLVCMTRACHIVDLEEDVQERIWGSPPQPGPSDAVLRQAP